MPDKINLAEKFSRINEYWKPYIAGELNGQLVKLDKLKGGFVWHHHEKHLVFVLVVVPDESAFQLVELYQLTIQFTGDVRLPIFLDSRELLGEVNLVRHGL